jgi:hypothetical protein
MVSFSASNPLRNVGRGEVARGKEGGPCKAKVTYSKVTVRIDKKVRRFEITMENIGTVNVLQSPQDLHREGRLRVCVCERERGRAW